MSLLKKADYTIHYFNRLANPRFSVKAVYRGFLLNVLGIKTGKNNFCFTRVSLAVINKSFHAQIISGKYEDEKSLVPKEFSK